MASWASKINLSILFLSFSTIVENVEITYGSAVRIKHFKSKTQLYSGKIYWDSQAGRLAVSGSFEDQYDEPYMWYIKKVSGGDAAGMSVQCGDEIYLQNVLGHFDLYAQSSKSSHIDSGLEVSVYKSHEDENVFILNCIESPDEYWHVDNKFSLTHKLTGGVLRSSSSKKYNNSNCRGCPILGHTEIWVTKNKVSKPSADDHFVAFGGMLISPIEENEAQTRHDEL